LASYRLIG